jgi:hypothetical protein
MASFMDKLQAMQDVNKGKTPEQEKYESLVKSQKAMDVIGLGLPPGLGMGIKALNDMQIAKMEKKNPELAPLNLYTAANRNRYSTLGQIFGGYGYDPRFPTPSLIDRATNALLGRDYVPREAFNVVTNRGIPVFDVMGGVQVASGGWETGGGGDGPEAGRGTSNFGGRESAVSDNDYSGYA